jgi:REP element-mobilizing transposase RayT
VPRKLRIHEPGSIHHVTSHGIASMRLYEDDVDRWRFLGILGDVTRECDWRILAFCLMTTHVHLLVEVREHPLWRPMHLLNSRYGRHVNRRHGRKGHVFDGRYHDAQISDEGHLLAAFRYIALNPCEAGICSDPAAYPWSSYAALIGAARQWSFVRDGPLWSMFAPSRSTAVERMRAFVEQVPGTGTVPGT